MVFYRPSEVQRFNIRKQTINNTTFILTDTQGNELNIFSNDAQITLKIEYMYKPEYDHTKKAPSIMNCVN